MMRDIGQNLPAWVEKHADPLAVAKLPFGLSGGTQPDL